MSDILLITPESEKDERVSWDKIRTQLKEIGGELEDAFGASSIAFGGPAPIALDSVAIELGVTASGEVGIILSKAKVEVGTRITLTFTRPKS